MKYSSPTLKIVSENGIPVTANFSPPPVFIKITKKLKKNKIKTLKKNDIKIF